MTFSLAGVPADQARFFAPDALASWVALHKLSVGRSPRLRPHPSLPSLSLWELPPLVRASLVFRDHPRMTAEVESWGLVLDGRVIEALPQPASWLGHVVPKFGDELGLRLVDVGGDAIELPRATFLTHLLRGELPVELTTPAFAASMEDAETLKNSLPALPFHVGAPLRALSGLALTCLALPRSVLVDAARPLADTIASQTWSEAALDPVVFDVRKALHDFCQTLWWQVVEAERFPARARAESERLAIAMSAVRTSILSAPPNIASPVVAGAEQA